MKYLSTFSGIEAATVAWHPLGWEPVGFSEIEPFPCGVLAHHYPNVPNYGDINSFRSWPESTFDVLVGGSPCQSFSVAGLRKGLDDPRGNLMLTYLAVADHYRPRWVVWENVPGVLSSGGGRDFGTFLGALEELGYGWAYRVLDAQYFGVAQRRRRVFVVGHLGDWRRAAAVLFERESLSGHPAPRREKRQDTTGSTGDGIARCLSTGEAKRQDWETCNFVAAFKPGQPEAAGALFVTDEFAPTLQSANNGSTQVPAVAFGMTTYQTPKFAQEVQPTIQVPSASGGGQPPAVVAFQSTMNTPVTSEDVSPTIKVGSGLGIPPPPAVAITVAPPLTASNDPSRSPQSSEVTQQVAAVVEAAAGPMYYSHDYNQDRVYGVGGPSEGLTTARRPNFMVGAQVRRLTPTECERLQGFPEGYTNIPWRGKLESPDGPRYKALGNSMAVPVMRWIGERIQMVEDL